ncbi:reticulon-1-A-like isoform X3 [Littorina saxatilis]|uniref:Reticulon-like protein n=1 Tax=Littorina saxatilis TaxID=31220 RepID=A0AAN9BGZ7_9CAEN
MSDQKDQTFQELSGYDPGESNNFAVDDFETLGTSGGAYDPQGTIPEQDEEITTTNAFGGEEPAEEDRYAAGASDGVQPSNPLISWGDEEDESLSQPSAAVPDSQASALDDLGGLSALTGAQSAFKSPSPSDPYSNPPQESEAVYSTEPVSAPQETKAAGQWLKNVDPRVLDLIYWRDARKTGVVFGSMMLVLLSLAFFSLLSVLAYLSLAILTVTLSFRVYKNIMAAVQKTNDGHPFKMYLDLDITLKEEKVSRVTQTVMQHVNCILLELRRLFLIEDLVDSIKFGLLLWVLTYVGSWFNGMTLIILLVIDVFTLPKVYETYKVQIDNYVNMATTQVNGVLAQVQSKLPFLKKKAKTQ